MSIERSTCVLSGVEDLERVAGFDAFPVFMGCTDRPEAEDILRPMQWWQSAGTGMLQLRPLLDLDLVYLAAHNAMVGETWDAHHAALADLIEAEAPRRVFELAGADGALAHKVFDRVPDCRWTCIDTNPTTHDDERLSVVTGIIDETLRVPDDADLVVHSHFLEHAYRPRQLLESLGDSMQLGQRMVFSVPNQVAQFEAGYGNVLNFEHTYFCRREYLEWLLATVGFVVVRCVPFRDHSLQFLVERSDRSSPPDLDWHGLHDENRSLMLRFVDGLREDATEVNRRITDADGPVYLFGAHVTSQYLIGAGLDLARIECVFDNNSMKQGLRLYGSPLEVRSPEQLRGVQRPHLVVRMANYQDEVVAQLNELTDGQVVIL